MATTVLENVSYLLTSVNIAMQLFIHSTSIYWGLTQLDSELDWWAKQIMVPAFMEWERPTFRNRKTDHYIVTNVVCAIEGHCVSTSNLLLVTTTTNSDG